MKEKQFFRIVGTAITFVIIAWILLFVSVSVYLIDQKLKNDKQKRIDNVEFKTQNHGKSIKIR